MANLGLQAAAEPGPPAPTIPTSPRSVLSMLNLCEPIDMAAEVSSVVELRFNAVAAIEDVLPTAETVAPRSLPDYAGAGDAGGGGGGGGSVTRDKLKIEQPLRPTPAVPATTEPAAISAAVQLERYPLPQPDLASIAEEPAIVAVGAAGELALRRHERNQQNTELKLRQRRGPGRLMAPTAPPTPADCFKILQPEFDVLVLDTQRLRWNPTEPKAGVMERAMLRMHRMDQGSAAAAAAAASSSATAGTALVLDRILREVIARDCAGVKPPDEATEQPLHREATGASDPASSRKRPRGHQQPPPQPQGQGQRHRKQQLSRTSPVEVPTAPAAFGLEQFIALQKVADLAQAKAFTAEVSNTSRQQITPPNAAGASNPGGTPSPSPSPSSVELLVMISPSAIAICRALFDTAAQLYGTTTGRQLPGSWAVESGATAVGILAGLRPNTRLAEQMETLKQALEAMQHCGFEDSMRCLDHNPELQRSLFGAQQAQRTGAAVHPHPVLTKIIEELKTAQHNDLLPVIFVPPDKPRFVEDLMRFVADEGIELANWTVYTDLSPQMGKLAGLLQSGVVDGLVLAAVPGDFPFADFGLVIQASGLGPGIAAALAAQELGDRSPRHVVVNSILPDDFLPPDGPAAQPDPARPAAAAAVASSADSAVGRSIGSKETTEVVGILCSHAVASRSHLVQAVETPPASGRELQFQLVVGQKTRMKSADIMLTATTAVVIADSAADFVSEQGLKSLVQRCLVLSFSFTRIYVIVGLHDGFSSAMNQGVSALQKVMASFTHKQSSSSKSTFRLQYSHSLTHQGELVRRLIAEFADSGFTPEVDDPTSNHELFLLNFPSLNYFSVQKLLEQLSLVEIAASTAEELATTCPEIGLRALENFIQMLHDTTVPTSAPSRMQASNQTHPPAAQGAATVRGSRGHASQHAQVRYTSGGGDGGGSFVASRSNQLGVPQPHPDQRQLQHQHQHPHQHLHQHQHPHQHQHQQPQARTEYHQPLDPGDDNDDEQGQPRLPQQQKRRRPVQQQPFRAPVRSQLYGQPERQANTKPSARLQFEKTVNASVNQHQSSVFRSPGEAGGAWGHSVSDTDYVFPRPGTSASRTPQTPDVDMLGGRHSKRARHDNGDKLTFTLPVGRSTGQTKLMWNQEPPPTPTTRWF